MKKISLFLLYLCMFIPISVVYAYSEYIIASGKNIGIELKSNYALIVGSYDIGSYNPLIDTDLKIGDKIIKINDFNVSSVYDIEDIVNNQNSNTLEVTYLRGSEEYKTDIKVYQEDNTLRTGLYIKDTIRGVATLTYIDPGNNSTFGALGHEILERTTKSRFESDKGTIFSSTVTSITKSEDGNPGEKNSRSDSSKVIGNVKENTQSGIFGSYIDSLPNTKLYKVAKPEEIKLGNAKMMTVIEEEKVEMFDINIIKINNNSKTKNILFEVTDKTLLEKTGGIIQGMSGSPIIQGDNIIGAVNYVLVDATNKGYGIFITNMLEEAEK